MQRLIYNGFLCDVCTRIVSIPCPYYSSALVAEQNEIYHMYISQIVRTCCAGNCIVLVCFSMLIFKVTGESPWVQLVALTSRQWTTHAMYWCMYLSNRCFFGFAHAADTESMLLEQHASITCQTNPVYRINTHIWNTKYVGTTHARTYQHSIQVRIRTKPTIESIKWHTYELHVNSVWHNVACHGLPHGLLPSKVMQQYVQDCTISEFVKT